MKKTEINKIAQILTTTKQPALKYQIMQRCSLPTSHFNEYRKLLLQTGLLNAYPAINLKHTAGRKTRRRMIYQTSKTGIIFLKKYNKLMMILQNQKEEVKPK